MCVKNCENYLSIVMLVIVHAECAERLRFHCERFFKQNKWSELGVEGKHRK